MGLAMRNVEIFSKGLQEGKTVGKALEDVLLQQIQDHSMRYLRAKEGGVLPPEARADRPDSKDGKKPKDPKQSEGATSAEYLLPLHTQAAYSIIGVPWLTGESGPGAQG